VLVTLRQALNKNNMVRCGTETAAALIRQVLLSDNGHLDRRETAHFSIGCTAFNKTPVFASRQVISNNQLAGD